ncbi:CDP-alcohol phosphatidyltransferase family protein [Methylocaldum marinum]|uniref:CDP-diacylglycerol--glycerol-3-phosphate 3-phosphatidyltransferase n=1 Tax=Methylocaldum marinum TaxID=1432792 RepID=A0A250KR25_9GAMM|nr:CDP-alcohol phosphatidyltransferase family protein [Methylocaldum marinum]BBA34115.1 CDP-alcohol phosphatidyltransferase family protein [Methylocaldum marinum]
MKARHIPNIISFCRILLVYPVITSMLEKRFDWALSLFVIAGVSDAIDGFLAKHFQWQSRLGSYIDPLADKLLLVSSYIALSFMGLIPFWLMATVVLRDLVIFTGAILYYFLLRPFDGQPLLISKVNTLLQLFLVFIVLLHHGFVPLPAGIITGVTAAVFVTTMLSGAMYIYVWGSSYYRETRYLGTRK